LALSDSGRIWSWQDIEHRGLHVKFLSHDLKERGEVSGKGVVKKVVAGWNKSAALIEGSGIVVWDVLKRGTDDDQTQDAVLVLQSVVVPKTDKRQSVKRSELQSSGPSNRIDEIAEVQNFVVLEHMIVFNTIDGKVFAAQIHWTRDEQRISQPVELKLSEADSEDENFATDVQGSFRSFAVFTRSGNVLTGTQDRLADVLHTASNDQSQLFRRIPALQQKQVIQLAFGDWHFHALHAPGHITSYGMESQTCGALGLGGHGDGEGRLRGIRYMGAGGDGHLVPHAYAEGRRVWFEREKRAWIKFLTSGAANAAEGAERVRMAIGWPDIRCQGEVSEWVEQEGRDWETKYGIRSQEGDGGDAYFALSVTAAGWHSGALVLVNDDTVARLKRAVELKDPPEPEVSSSKQDDEPAVEQQRTSSPGPQKSSGLLGSITSTITSTIADYGAWFLGLPPYNAQYTVPDGDQPDDPSIGMTAQMGDFQRGLHPINYGASPRVGVRYIWADDHFPRLRLSDGTEMPGEVDFDEWRYDRPDFDLDFTP